MHGFGGVSLFPHWRVGESVLAHSLPRCDWGMGTALGPEVYCRASQCPQELPPEGP